MGNRKGFLDARGTMFFELAKIIEAKRPSALVLENVRRLASHSDGAALQRITEIIKELGYWVDHKILNALDFGLPQKRERVLIVGFKESVSGFEWPDKPQPMTPLKVLLETAPDQKFFVNERIRRKRHAAHTAKVKPAIWHENKSGHVSSYPYSCALRASASYNYLLVDGERRLTPRELLRLQGFPDTFKIIGRDSYLRKQTGNSVPVPMIRSVIERVLRAKRT